MLLTLQLNRLAKHNDAKFKKLEKIWYDKLKAEGFEDIENIHQEERRLKEWDFNFFRNQFVAVKYETTIKYYEQGRQILNSYEFKTEIHKKIWELHCEGIAERKIAQAVKIYKKSMVHVIIAEIAKMIKRE